MAYIHPFGALGDATRRSMMERLRRGPQTVGQLANFAAIRQPTASQHLRVLSDAGLVIHDKIGTSHYYRVNPAGVEELRRYVESFWDGVLVAYANADLQQPRVARAQRKSRRRGEGGRR